MKRYNYLESMIETVLEYVRDEWEHKEENGTEFSSREALEEDLSENLRDELVNYTIWYEDAENCLYHNWTLLMDAVEELGIDEKSLSKYGPCYADSLIRDYLLYDAIREALDILESNDEITYSADATEAVTAVYICDPATV